MIERIESVPFADETVLGDQRKFRFWRTRTVTDVRTALDAARCSGVPVAAKDAVGMRQPEAAVSAKRALPGCGGLGHFNLIGGRP